jgi:hypothetical protein
VSRSLATGGRAAVSVHVATTGPMRDEDDEDGWDTPGATSLRTFRKSPNGTLDLEDKLGRELKSTAL